MRRMRVAVGLVLGVLVFADPCVAAAQEGAPAAGAPASAPPAQQQPVWSTTCTGATRSSIADCAIEQRVFLSQTGQLFGAMTIRVPADTRAPVMMLQLPLGLFLPAGIAIAVDGGTPEALPVQTCEASGCYAGSPISAALLAAMKKGSQLGITFQNMQKKSITMPISLSGFTAAFSAIE